MSVHRYTVADLKNAISHAVGGTPTSTLPSIDIINGAIDFVCNYSSWSWQKRELALSFTSGQKYISLPADFKRIHNVVRNANFEPLIPTTLEEIHLMRSSPVGVVGLFATHFAISMSDQASVAALPLYRLEIYPTPTATTANAIIGTYIKLTPAVSSDTDVPEIPSPWHEALRSICRGKARSDQFRDGDDDWMQGKVMLDQLVAQDGAAQPSLGQMKGAVGRRRANGCHSYMSGTIVPPS